MQVNGIINSMVEQKKQNFKGDSVNSVVISDPKNVPAYQPIPSGVSKAYAFPQLTQGYKEIQTFEVPYVGKGKMYELANGHKILIIPKPGPTIINTAVKTGKMNEPKELSSISHLLEHLVCNNLIKPKDPETTKQIANLAISANAETSLLKTSYYMDSPFIDSENLESFVKLHSQTIQNNKFTPEDVEKEKNVIIAEKNYRKIESDPELIAYQASTKNLYNSNLADCVTNLTEQTIKNITYKDLMDYYSSQYKPTNMVTTIVGNVDFENSIKILNKHLGGIKSSDESSPKFNAPEISSKDFIQKTIRNDIQSKDKDVKTTTVQLSFIGPQNNNYKDIILLVAVNKVLQASLEEENNNKETRKVYFGYSIDDNSLKENAPKSLNFESNIYEDKDTEESLKTMYSHIFASTQNKISQKTLDTIKKQLKNDLYDAFEYSSDLSNTVNDNLLYSGNLDKITQRIKVIDSMTPQDIQNTAKKYFNLNKASLVVVHQPKKSPFDVVKSADRTSFTGNSVQLNSSDIHEYLLPNNLRVVIDSRPGVTKSSVRMEFHSQKLLNQKPGVTSLLNCMVGDVKNIEQKEKEGISTNFITAAPQYIAGLASCVPGKTMETIEYLQDELLNPKFDPKKFDDKKEFYTSLYDEEPMSAWEKSTQDFYSDNPYNSVDKNFKDVVPDDVLQLYAQIRQNAQGSVIITVPPEELKNIKGQIFQSLLQIPQLKPNNYQAIFNKFKPIPLQKKRIYLDGKDTSENNNQIEISQRFKICESGNIKDIAGLAILNQLLCADDNSKLFVKLRKEQGLVYSPDSSYTRGEFSGKVALMEMNAETTIDKNVNKDNLVKVVDGFNKVINEFVSIPITQDELESAKIAIKANIMRNLESASARNRSIAEGYNSFYGVSYQQELLAAIDKITPAYVQKLAQYYLTQPSQLVVSGNKEAIEANKAYLSSLGEVVD